MTHYTKAGGKYTKLQLNYQIATKLPNDHKICIPYGRNIFQMAIEYTHQPFPFQGPPKFTQIGLKIYHLATLANFQNKISKPHDHY
jgi:hypothetical protein